MPVPDAESIIPVINRLREEISFDWHPKDHISFFSNVKKYELHPSSKIKADQAQMYQEVIFKGPQGQEMPQTLWPDHCVQETEGSELHKKLKICKKDILVKKGSKPNIDSYSGFYVQNLFNLD